MEKKNKTVIVTGGTRGIGLKIVKKYLSEGWDVIILSRNSEFEESLSSSELKKITSYKCDLTKQNEVMKIAELLKNKSVNALISNVGSGSGSRDVFPPDEEWNKIWDINFTSSKNTAKYFHKLLEKNNGHLIFISSIAGVEFLDAPIAYSVSKSALITYSKILSKRLSPEIRVNTIVPGNILTKDGVWSKKMKNSKLETEKYINDKVPLKKLGNADEIADLVFFVSSDKISFMNGSTIIIDGGQTSFL
jgi:3-oxoacyl-[acyl-carrier protein] reductase